MTNTTKDRLKMIAGAYIIPVIVMVVFMTRGMVVNGAEASLLVKASAGFVLGMMAEGFCMMLFFAIAIITGKLD